MIQEATTINIDCLQSRHPRAIHMKISGMLRSTALFCILILVSNFICPGPADTGQTSLPSPDQVEEASGLPAGDTRGRLSTDLSDAAARVAPLLDRYGYPLLFAAILVEGMGIPAPGQTLLIAASLAAARGNLGIAWVLIWSFSAALLGNSIGYLIGLRGGRPLLRRFRVKETHLQRMEGVFARAGKGIILVARFVDGLKQLNGIVAGLLRMPWKIFTMFNILGAVLWVGFWALGSYFLEREISQVHITLQQVEPWIAGLAVASVLSLIVYALCRKGNGNRF
jgi:membrane protein DedA with SNARE-associated domain